MKKFWSLFFVLALAALALAACGGGKGPSTTIDLTMTDFHYEPSEFVVPAGKEITLHATNKGAVAHDFIVMKYGTNAGEKFGDEDKGNIYWEVEVDPGKSGSFTFTAPSEPGEYQVVCGVEGHFEAGMVGKLTVVAP
ncbi:MAG: cupredoxin domain-containing protein [Anaerolineae bacterium]